MRFRFPVLLFLFPLALAARAADFAASPLPPDVERINARAEAAADPAERIRLYAVALRKFPANEPARYAIARHFLANGAPAKALFLARGLAEKHPESADILLLRAQAALSLATPGRSELDALAASLADCAAAAADPARRAEALLYRSACVRLAGGFAEAPAIARRALEEAADAGLPLAPYRLEKDLADEAAALFSPVE
jgi:hypothetical protein